MIFLIRYLTKAARGLDAVPHSRQLLRSLLVNNLDETVNLGQ